MRETCRKQAFGLLLAITLFIIILDSTHAYEYKSARGCPPEKGFEVWLKDDVGKCHKLNSKGPCGDNMVFFPSPNGKERERGLGFCDCFDARRQTKQEILFQNNRNLTHCLKDLRSQAFVPERNRCYSLFDQGPCSPGKWLVLNATFYPICVKNDCSLEDGSDLESRSLSPRFRFSHSQGETCYETMTQGYCPKASFQLRFSSNNWLPKCRFAPRSGKTCPKKSSTGEILRTKCKPGSRRDYLSKCTRSIGPR